MGRMGDKGERPMSKRTESGKLPRRKKWERSKRPRCWRRHGQGRMCEKKWQEIVADFKAQKGSVKQRRLEK